MPGSGDALRLSRPSTASEHTWAVFHTKQSENSQTLDDDNSGRWSRNRCYGKPPPLSASPDLYGASTCGIALSWYSLLPPPMIFLRFI
jgi:hypothetical protein